jgi:hypothetical protein
MTMQQLKNINKTDKHIHTHTRQLERNFEELKPASHVPILGTISNIFDVFVTVFFSLLNSLNFDLLVLFEIFLNSEAVFSALQFCKILIPL